MSKFSKIANNYAKFSKLELTASCSTLSVAAIATVLSATIPLSLPYLFGHIIDGLFAREDTAMLNRYLLFTAILFSFGAMCNFYSSRVFARIGYDLARQLSYRVYCALLKMPVPIYSHIPKGVLTSRLTNDVRMLEPFFVEVPLTAARSCIAMLGAAMMILIINPWYIFVLAAIPVSVGVARFSERKIDDAIVESFENSASVATAVEDTLHPDAVKLVRQSGQTRREREFFNDVITHTAKILTKIFFWRISVRNGYDICFSLFSIIIIYFGIILVNSGSTTVGGVVAVLMYLRAIRQPLSDFIGLRYSIIRGTKALQRLEPILNSQSANLPLVESINQDKPRPAPSSNSSEQPVIEFVDVWFRYPASHENSIDGLTNVSSAVTGVGASEYSSVTKLTRKVERGEKGGDDRWILKGVSFSINRGDVLAIAGPSGGGKSTIVGLASGYLRPTRGCIKLYGVPTDEMPEEDMAKHASLVSQETYLRHASLKENLQYASESSSLNEIRQACEIAGMTNLIEELPQGIDTDLGSNGKFFSGGERQRVSIARAILQDRGLMILDEATSNLDSELENEILCQIGKYRNERAILLVAHRKAALSFADRIVQLKGGMISGQNQSMRAVENAQLT